MNEDRDRSIYSIMPIMENILSLKKKIEEEESKLSPNKKKLKIWNKELDKVQRGLERKRCKR